MHQILCVSTPGLWGGGGGWADQKYDIVRFGTYNIRNGCNGGLESEFRGMAQANDELFLLQ